MTPAAQAELAKWLAAARRDGRQVPALPPHLLPESHEEGYAVNALVAQALGWPTLGWKIAGTNPVMQQRLGSDARPIYGRSYRRFLVRPPASFRHVELLDPIVECEVLFRLEAALPPREADYTEDEVAAAVAAAHAGVEVAECRFPMAALPPMPAILADGAASGRYILGPEIPDWREALSDLPVVLEVDDAERRRGNTAEVMGHPLRALTWLANERRAWGDGLRDGEIISTGTCTGMLLAKPGQRMRARFGAAITLGFDFAG